MGEEPMRFGLAQPGEGFLPGGGFRVRGRGGVRGAAASRALGGSIEDRDGRDGCSVVDASAEGLTMSEERGSSRPPPPMSQSMSLPPWCPCCGEDGSNPAVVPVFPFPELLAVPMSAPSNAGVAGRHCASFAGFCSMGILSCRIASCVGLARGARSG